MGPPRNFLGKDVPQDILVWQDPIDEKTKSTIDAKAVKDLKAKILETGLRFIKIKNMMLPTLMTCASSIFVVVI